MQSEGSCLDCPALPGGRSEGSPRRCAMRGGGAVALDRLPAASLPLDERAVLAHEQVEMLALLVGELEKDLLAFGVFESLAVFLEEAMRVAFAADADQQGLLIVDSVQQAVGAFSEQAVRGSLEKQERGA